MTERILSTIGATIVFVWLLSFGLSAALDWDHPEIADIFLRVFLGTTGLIVMITFVITVTAIWTR